MRSATRRRFTATNPADDGALLISCAVAALQRRRRRRIALPVARCTDGKLTAGELTPTGAVGGNMRAVVTCECCGNRQAVARQIQRAETFYVVCHACESVLRVEVTDDELRAAQANLRQAKPTAAI